MLAGEWFTERIQKIDKSRCSRAEGGDGNRENQVRRDLARPEFPECLFGFPHARPLVCPVPQVSR